MAKRTATIERYHCYGTPRHHLCVRYRGKTLSWSAGPSWHIVYADAWHYGADTFRAMVQHAENRGFTHVRIVGDWTHSTKPAGGSIARILSKA